jgi:hypothetical protein
LGASGFFFVSSPSKEVNATLREARAQAVEETAPGWSV